jgi:hypothetical protein
MEQKEIENLFRRYSCADEKARLWYTFLDTPYRYTIPDRAIFFNRTEAQPRNVQIFDSTGVQAVKDFVSLLHSVLTPTGQQWCSLVASETIRDDLKDQLNKGLETATTIMFEYLKNSNFDQASAESHFDLSISVGLLKCDEGPDHNPLIFSSVWTGDACFEEGPLGDIQDVYRRFDKIKIRDMIANWDDIKLTPVMQAQEKTQPECEYSLIEMTILDTDNLMEEKYKYLVFEASTKALLVERELKSSPWIAYRWLKTPGETFGRGPVLDAMPSILTLNKMMEDELGCAELNMFPPMMSVDSNLFNPNTIRLSPHTIIPVKPMGMSERPPLFPVTTSSPNVQFSQIVANELREQIKNSLYSDPLGSPEGPVRSATEMALRQQNFSRRTGPPFSRLEVEYQAKVIKRVVYILQKKGLLPKLDIGGRAVNLVYQSPLTQNQNQIEIQELTQFSQTLAGIVGPELAMMGIKAEKLPMWIAQRTGMDLDLVNSEAEIKDLADKARQTLQNTGETTPGQIQPIGQPPNVQ